MMIVFTFQKCQFSILDYQIDPENKSQEFSLYMLHSFYNYIVSFYVNEDGEEAFDDDYVDDDDDIRQCTAAWHMNVENSTFFY